jgi:hypothetical protein
MMLSTHHKILGTKIVKQEEWVYWFCIYLPHLLPKKFFQYCSNFMTKHRFATDLKRGKYQA